MINPEEPSIESSWTLRIFRGPSRKWIWDRTVGLYFRTETGNPTMQGSGVLLKIADAAFVLSAAHVLKLGKDMEIQIGAMAKGSKLIKLPAAQFAFSDDLTDLDLGFVRISTETANELSRFKEFARMSDLDLRTCQPCSGAYCVLGFPQQLNTPDHVKREINPLHLHYLCHPVPDAAEAKPEISFLLRMTKDTVVLSDPENSISEEQRMPELYGISGCGMWRLYGVEDRVNRLDLWQPSWIKLVGIEHGWGRRKWVKGAFVRHVVDMIEGAYPELRASIQLTQ